MKSQIQSAPELDHQCQLFYVKAAVSGFDGAVVKTEVRGQRKEVGSRNAEVGKREYRRWKSELFDCGLRIAD
jgi:hypothetical protein